MVHKHQTHMCWYSQHLEHWILQHEVPFICHLSPFEDSALEARSWHEVVACGGQILLLAVGFFTPTSALPSCGCGGEKLLGDILLWSRCNQRVHALCSHQAKCFKRVWRISDSPWGVLRENLSGSPPLPGSIFTETPIVAPE